MLGFPEGVPKHVGSCGLFGSGSMCQAVEFPHFSVLGCKPFAYFESKGGVYIFCRCWKHAESPYYKYFYILPNAPIGHTLCIPYNYWFCLVHYSIITSPSGIVWSEKKGTRNSDTSSWRNWAVNKSSQLRFIT